jgi:dsDNA-specific endonuclease/ATPase MutS2
MNDQVVESLRQELAELRKKYNELKTLHEYQVNQLVNQLNKEALQEVKNAKKELREVVIYFENGDYIETSMSSQLTDEEIRAYYAVGKIFNVGNGPQDNLQRVASVKILK